MQHPKTGAVVKIPNSLAGQYARGDANIFWRDYGGLPMAAVSPYDPHAEHFLEKCRTLAHLPDVDEGQGVYVHADIGLRHDSCCVAMVMAVGDKATLSRAKIIPPREDTREVEISDIREQVRYWRSQGWYIRQVSADSFASESLLQQLRRDGFDVRVVSVDRTPAAYEALKAALHEERFAYFDSEATQLFEREYAALELIEGVRVDHPPKGSKDMSDAIAGATCEALANADSNLPWSQVVQF